MTSRKSARDHRRALRRQTTAKITRRREQYEKTPPRGEHGTRTDTIYEGSTENNRHQEQSTDKATLRRECHEQNTKMRAFKIWQREH